MNRRRFLTLSSLGLLTASSGCTAMGSESSLPPGMTITTRHSREGILKDELIDLTELRDPLYIAGTLLTTEEAALAQIQHDSRVKALVEETDFTTSYLAVIQYYGSSSYSLEVHSIDRKESSIHVRFEERPESEFITADLSSHYLVIRVTEENPKPPTDISAELVS